jgi:low affinity Fe/Cu permease
VDASVQYRVREFVVVCQKAENTLPGGHFFVVATTNQLLAIQVMAEGESLFASHGDHRLMRFSRTWVNVLHKSTALIGLTTMVRIVQTIAVGRLRFSSKIIDGPITY